MSKWEGKELADYFTELIEKVRRDEPKLAEAMDLFREANKYYQGTAKAMSYMRPEVFVNPVSCTNMWTNHEYVSTTARKY